MAYIPLHGRTEDGSSIDDLLTFAQARHDIWRKKAAGEPPPWTDDPILQAYHFTNVYRELDRGTIALRSKLNAIDDPSMAVFTSLWYRMTNRVEHMEAVGGMGMMAVSEYLRSASRVFTAAYVTTSPQDCSDKLDAYIGIFQDLWSSRRERALALAQMTMSQAHKKLQEVKFVGAFIAYEVVADLRHTACLKTSDEPMTWAHVGPGAKRGLVRLGMAPTAESLRFLLSKMPLSKMEMKDVEHTLCEFGKYRAILLGERTGARRYRHEATPT